MPFLVMILLLCLGLFTGTKANLTIGEGIYLNSPYSIGFLTGFISLSIIFIATVTGTQLLFKEQDSRFDRILFTTPVTKAKFAAGRFISFYSVTLIGFLLLTIGFMIGQSMREGAEMQSGFHIIYYIYPFLLFGCVNTLFVCTLLSLLAWRFGNKLLIAVCGLLLYVLYMVVLVYSSSPFMSQSIPQSAEAQYISAIADPFGLSAYFFESKNFSVLERNTVLTPLSGSLLINRLIVTGASLIFLYLGKRHFSFAPSKKHKQKIADSVTIYLPQKSTHVQHENASVIFGRREFVRSVLSFAKTDITYIFKSIPASVISIMLLFFIGMEMYAEIEKGIRLPQKFASSGLMASTILESFHTLGIFIVVYYANELFWRSSLSRFSMIENVTYFSSSKLTGHWISISILILFLTVLAVLQGLVFQFSFHYTRIDVMAYLGVILFNSCPLILLTGFVLLLNYLIPNKYFALGVSLIIALITSGSFAGKIITNPLLRIFVGFNGEYSDFNGYGPYLVFFVQRLLFGFCLTCILWLLTKSIRTRDLKLSGIICSGLLVISGVFFAHGFMKGYESKSEQQVVEFSSGYEKQFRKYQSIPQPTITGLRTEIHLYNSKNRYAVEGIYALKNQTDKPIEKLLINFDNDIKFKNTQYVSTDEKIDIQNQISEIVLRYPIEPGDGASLNFSLEYAWEPVNGHKSFNAIIENGSFMRISRYYPQIGYRSDFELSDENERKKFNLGDATHVKKLEDTRTAANDLINLEMIIDTDDGQTAVGTGTLVKEWNEAGRNYFHYKTPEPVPFRFAVSSARYKYRSVTHDSIRINVYFHPEHEENVDHLIQNAGLTLDYCRSNFGPYPYKSVSFAEVSLFTKGFAATAYPAVIFMTENMIFHSNIKADDRQDVINELAGHELSHLWWGNNQIIPDDREGAGMLTETLAMYTEMMLYQKIYGKEEMMKRAEMHRMIYDSEKGFQKNEPLYKVTGDNTHISYSKGAFVMVQLSELIGEVKVNEALKTFLNISKKSGIKPVATDLIEEFLKVSDESFHDQIRKMFMEI